MHKRMKGRRLNKYAFSNQQGQANAGDWRVESLREAQMRDLYDFWEWVRLNGWMPNEDKGYSDSCLIEYNHTDGRVTTEAELWGLYVKRTTTANVEAA